MPQGVAIVLCVMAITTTRVRVAASSRFGRTRTACGTTVVVRLSPVVCRLESDQPGVLRVLVRTRHSRSIGHGRVKSSFAFVSRFLLRVGNGSLLISELLRILQRPQDVWMEDERNNVAPRAKVS
ncbi:hypothetical protein HDK77DRAFT_298044 [Phyllosticta capitalensis]